MSALLIGVHVSPAVGSGLADAAGGHERLHSIAAKAWAASMTKPDGPQHAFRLHGCRPRSEGLYLCVLDVGYDHGTLTVSVFGHQGVPPFRMEMTWDAELSHRDGMLEIKAIKNRTAETCPNHLDARECRIFVADIRSYKADHFRVRAQDDALVGYHVASGRGQTVTFK